LSGWRHGSCCLRPRAARAGPSIEAGHQARIPTAIVGNDAVGEVIVI
jgi:hypothetical protein